MWASFFFVRKKNRELISHRHPPNQSIQNENLIYEIQLYLRPLICNVTLIYLKYVIDI